MNQTIRDILTRRSIRKFLPDPVPQALLDQIMKPAFTQQAERTISHLLFWR